MQVAVDTGRDIDEVLSWPISKLELYVGFFRRREALRKRNERQG